ncbi:thioredoxin domain-containing protein [Moniliophthora roreri MCA 2997]|uniref:Thioredoxin domain-containing protein n=2 Tax=Moniliophthora roreri TaxID=221103 RepID=V2XFS2_MONRO|nr:thioredoxin domain-containing protein [Moniliophthora roreri MCA 2997]
MPSPPIQVFLTTIASQPALRQRQEYLLRILQVKKIPFTSYDLASDETAKRLWKRKAPLDKQQLPGILVGGKFPGTFTDFEESVEFDELDKFLRLKETWDPEVDQITEPPVQPIGVPGAALPLQMTPDHIRKLAIKRNPSPSPNQIPVNKRTGDFDVSEELSGYGLQGVRVTEDELTALVKELGLEGEDAGNLVKGLSTESDKTESAEESQPHQSANKEAKSEVKTEAKEAEDVKTALDTQQSQGVEGGVEVAEEKTKVEDAAVTEK